MMRPARALSPGPARGRTRGPGPAREAPAPGGLCIAPPCIAPKE